MLRYLFTFRWMKFALIALLGALAIAFPLMAIIARSGYPQQASWVFLPVYVPFAIWYFRRAGRNRVEFDAIAAGRERP